MSDRIDVPLTDTDEQYVFYNSPAVTTDMFGQVFHTEVCYGWSPDEPLILEMAISTCMNSVPLDDSLYPEGYVCDRCLLPMPYGTVGVGVPNGITGVDELVCIACARSLAAQDWSSETWEIGLQVVRDALEGRFNDTGDIIISRPTEDTLTFKFTGRWPDGSQGYSFVNLAEDRLHAFVAEIDRFMGADIAAVTDAFVDSGLDSLERFANGES